MADGRIFISYRRRLDQGTTGRLYDRLERHYDRRVFMDVDDIPLGVDFARYLTEQVEQCAVFLAVIGHGWIDALDRLQNESDFVRLEIEAALQRDIPVVPVLVDGVGMPDRGDVPECLWPLMGRNGISLRHDSFASDVDQRLVKGLNRLLSGSPGNAESDQQSDAQVPAEPMMLPAGTVFRDEDETWCPEMVMLPTGGFMMGSTTSEFLQHSVMAEQAYWEQPRHLVDIDRPIALARYATTFLEFDAFCSASSVAKPSDEGWGRDQRPVINVSWDSANEYCAWLSKMTGRTYGLPSEAIWEYGCRAGTETSYVFGDVVGFDQANFGKARNGTVAVDDGAFSPNAFNLHQMHGNVWEWCADDFFRGYDTPRTQQPFMLDPRKPRRVLRGGAWNSAANNLTSANRSGMLPDFQSNNLGFRVVRIFN